MKKLICAVLMLATASLAEARPKHFYKDKYWWIGTAVIGAALTADAHSSSRGRNMGFTESNHILGLRPSDRKIAGFAMLDFGIQTTLHAGAWHFTHHVPTTDPQIFAEDKLGWRILGYTAVPATVLVINGHAAARNYQLQGNVK